MCEQRPAHPKQQQKQKEEDSVWGCCQCHT